jgi:hypothetical protein
VLRAILPDQSANLLNPDANSKSQMEIANFDFGIAYFGLAIAYFGLAIAYFGLGIAYFVAGIVKSILE